MTKYIKGCASDEIQKCLCNLKLTSFFPLFDGEKEVNTPLVVGDIGSPKGKIEVKNIGTEPSFDATVKIKAEILTKEDSIKGCKSLKKVGEVRL